MANVNIFNHSRDLNVISYNLHGLNRGDTLLSELVNDRTNDIIFCSRTLDDSYEYEKNIKLFQKSYSLQHVCYGSSCW